MIDSSYLIAVGGLITAVIGGIAVFRKTKPDVSAVLVDAAQDVVVIQRGVIEELRVGLAEAHRQIKELQGLEAEVAGMRIRLRDLEDENTRLRSENQTLRDRVQHLEDERSKA